MVRSRAHGPSCCQGLVDSFHLVIRYLRGFRPWLDPMHLKRKLLALLSIRACFFGWLGILKSIFVGHQCFETHAIAFIPAQQIVKELTSIDRWIVDYSIAGPIRILHTQRNGTIELAGEAYSNAPTVTKTEQVFLCLAIEVASSIDRNGFASRLHWQEGLHIGLRGWNLQAISASMS